MSIAILLDDDDDDDDDDDFSIPCVSNCVIFKHLGTFAKDVILPFLLSMLLHRRVSYTEQESES
jgi:hypothetical protein